MPLPFTISCSSKSRLFLPSWLANCTIGRAFDTLCHLSVCLSVCRLSVCDILYCGKTVRPSKKLSEGVNRKPGSKSGFFGSPPYYYFRFAATAIETAVFGFFASTTQQSVLDGTNWLSSSKPCAYCRIVWSELKPKVVKKVTFLEMFRFLEHAVLTMKYTFTFASFPHPDSFVFRCSECIATFCHHCYTPYNAFVSCQ